MKDLFGHDAGKLPVQAKPAAPKPPAPAPKHYTCDQCQKRNNGSARVVLYGVAGRLGLSMPGELQERTFCGEACFWLWIAGNKPATPAVFDPATITFSEP